MAKDEDGSVRAVVFLFERGSKAIPPDTNWEYIVATTKEALRPSQRSAYVLGRAAADDAETPEARHQLALGRAEAVRTALIERGVDPARLQASAVPDTGPAWDRSRWTSERRHAAIKLLPSGKLRDELEPTSDEYRNYCADVVTTNVVRSEAAHH